MSKLYFISLFITNIEQRINFIKDKNIISNQENKNNDEIQLLKDRYGLNFTKQDGTKNIIYIDSFLQIYQNLAIFAETNPGFWAKRRYKKVLLSCFKKYQLLSIVSSLANNKFNNNDNYKNLIEDLLKLFTRTQNIKNNLLYEELKREGYYDEEEKINLIKKIEILNANFISIKNNYELEDKEFYALLEWINLIKTYIHICLTDKQYGSILLGLKQLNTEELHHKIKKEFAKIEENISLTLKNIKNREEKIKSDLYFFHSLFKISTETLLNEEIKI